MSEYALRDGSSIDAPPPDDLKSRINTALARPCKSAAAAFAKAKADNRAYALIGTGIMLFTVPSNRVHDRMQPRDFLGRVELDPALCLDVPPQQVRYAPNVLESGIFGAGENGELLPPAFAIRAGQDKIDLCNIFLACGSCMGEFQDSPDLAALTRKLDQRNLKAYVALAAHVPESPSVRPYAAEVVLVVSRDNEKELPLFNLGKHLLMPSGYSGNGYAPTAAAMAGKVQYQKALA